MMLRPWDAFKMAIWVYPLIVGVSSLFILIRATTVTWNELLVVGALWTVVMSLWRTAYRRPQA